MHISLDSELGRQRRLNQIGETITSIAAPAAAYSLRSLTGGDPLAVRVRRDTGGGAGDDDEEDFTVSAVASGALLDFVGSGNDGFVTIWYDQSGNNRHLIQGDNGEQPSIVESGTFLNGVKSNKASSNDTMQNLQVSTDGVNANFGTDDWATGASSKLGLIYVGTVPHSLIFKTSSDAVIWGGGRGVSSYQSGGLSLQVIKSGNDAWKLVNERQGLSPARTIEGLQTSAQNTDNDIIWYGIADNRDFTVSVNGAVETDTESADLDVRENTPLSLFGSYAGDGSRYYQRSGGGVCKECYLYAGTNITSIPTVATKINEHYSIYS